MGMLRVGPGIGALIAVLLATACDSGGGTDGTPPPVGTKSDGPTSSSSEPTGRGPLADPPLAFMADAVPLGAPNGEFEVHEHTAYFFEKSTSSERAPSVLVAKDLATGSQRWSWTAGEPTADFAAAFSRSLLFVTEFVTVKGTGTALDRTFTRVTAIRTADGIQKWTVDLPEDGLQDGVGALSGTADEHVVVLGGQQVVVLDPGTGSILSKWSTSLPYEQARVVDDVLVGVEGKAPGILDDEDTRVTTGRAVLGGRRLWALATNPDYVEISDLGSTMVSLAGTVEARPPSTTIIVEVATGKVIATVKSGHFCWFDEDSTIVCQNNSYYSYDDHIVALDKTSGRTLWQFPAPGRKMPDILFAWHGAIYAETDTGEFILDARTGDDKVPSLPFHPIRVAPGYGFAKNESGGIFSYPALPG